MFCQSVPQPEGTKLNKKRPPVMRICIKLSVWTVKYSAGLSHLSFYLKQPLQKNKDLAHHNLKIDHGIFCVTSDLLLLFYFSIFWYLSIYRDFFAINSLAKFLV
jgi:hypothetical protein